MEENDEGERNRRGAMLVGAGGGSEKIKMEKKRAERGAAMGLVIFWPKVAEINGGNGEGSLWREAALMGLAVGEEDGATVMAVCRREEMEGDMVDSDIEEVK
ncbi:hypothetical protein HAX54_017855 [Datura stramonium]|uniref:Uncharacterized protein n=1 Tax=Datura stramonium TaxID=4076 RepID=A0ABS8ULE1_DATST|nr:hypothetical protein [Datura stramonium]